MHWVGIYAEMKGLSGKSGRCTYSHESRGEVDHGHDGDGLHHLTIQLCCPGDIAHADVLFPAVLGQPRHVICIFTDSAIIFQTGDSRELNSANR